MQFLICTVGFAAVLACASAASIKATKFMPDLPALEINNFDLPDNFRLPVSRSASLRQNNNCNCGQSSLSKQQARIAGGEPASNGEFPWTAYLEVFYRDRRDGKNYKSECSAIIIDPRNIITAASCFYGEDKQLHGARIRVGSVDKSAGTSYNGIELRTGNYSSDTMQDDIAIMKIQKVIEFNENVQPVCLPFKYQDDPDLTGKVWASGWGTEEVNGPTMKHLRKVELDMITNEECNSYDMNVEAGQVCTYTPGKDTCEGDSGAPISYYDERGAYYAMGITSYGYGCARENSPAVYTRVAQYVDVIKYYTGYDYCEQ